MDQDRSWVADRVALICDEDTWTWPEFPLLERSTLHYVRNEDTIGFHGTRVEFKRGFPADP
jgi:hypothetical protein